MVSASPDAPAGGCPAGFDLQDISGHPGTALKELSAELREKITTCLGKCKRRVPETQWEEIQADIKYLFDQKPQATLHWEVRHAMPLPATVL